MGHPAKEGLRQVNHFSVIQGSKPRVGHPAKEGLRQMILMPFDSNMVLPRVGHPAKEGLRHCFVARAKP